MAYLDMWRSGTFPKNSNEASALPIANTDRRTTERSTSDRLGDIFLDSESCFTAVQNVPYLHTSRHVIPRDSVLPGLPPTLILQATNAGVRRPGCEATVVWFGSGQGLCPCHVPDPWLLIPCTLLV